MSKIIWFDSFEDIVAFVEEHEKHGATGDMFDTVWCRSCNRQFFYRDPDGSGRRKKKDREVHGWSSPYLDRDLGMV